MMPCPSCAAQAPIGARFCNDCGAALRASCAACGHANPAGARFCSDCGARLGAAAPLAPRSSRAAERRYMTVMFSDLVGSSALSAQLDQEDLLEVMAAYYQLVQTEVNRLGGFIARHIGDGVLVYFGYPAAHEDDAERAVRAGLGVVANIGRLDIRAGVRLEVRVGIATGPVIVDAIGSGATEERMIYGESPNLASRLQGLAEPGSVVVDQSTFRLVHMRFDCRDLGRREIRGLAPVPIWQIERARSDERRVAAALASQTPLVGRREETELVLRRWAQAKAGEGCAVLLSGEPGIGKSRIVQALLDTIGHEPHVALKYYGSAIHQESAFFPVIAQLEHAAGFEPGDSPGAQIGKLERHLARCSADLSKDVALLAELLSIDAGSRPRLDLTPRRRMEETFSALLGQIAGAAASQPVVVVFEDAHWLDPSSQELLQRLIERVPPLRALLVVTARPEFQPAWTGQPQVALLPLERLSSREQRRLIEMLTDGRPLPEALTRQIVEHTDGVPLFVEELTKTVLESGSLREDHDGYVLSETAPALTIPTTLQASLLARLDRLSVVREIAQEAAAIGREFAYELFAAVTTRDEAELMQGLEQLTAAGLLLQRGVPPRTSYSFKHALMQDAAYATLLRAKREALHARIAAVYEQQFEEVVETRPELLAHHLEQAGLVERAIDAWLRAARNTSERGAMAAAVAQLRRGLALVGQLADARARQTLELTLQVALGGALMAARGYTGSETDAAFRRARELCLAQGDTDQLMRVTWGRFTGHFAGGRMLEALAEAEELLRLSEGLGDPAGRQIGYASLGATLLHLGRLSQARARLESAVEIVLPNRREMAFLYGQSGRVTALSYLSLALLLLGFPDRSRQVGREATELAHALSHPTSLCFAHSVLCRVEFLRRDKEATAGRAQEVVELAARHGLELWRALGDIYSGWSKAGSGAANDAAASIRAGISKYRAVGAGLSLPLYFASLAGIERRAGNPRACLDLLRDAEAAAAAGHEHWADAEIRRQRGEALRAIGDEARAESELRAALALAQEEGAVHWQLRAAASLARLLQRRGEPCAADETLRRVLGKAAGSATADAQEARALLDAFDRSDA